ncbi:D-glycero-beta-D-manno-heptose 1,7-bisphosphate 7-phosphatase [bacterium]|nr:D-glycero-beta-D-manno-heptose 1,7-bisphosphate 7-phosphatase [bacterium]
MPDNYLPFRPKLVFLDRDGTLIIDKHYLHKPEEVELFPGAGEAVARLNQSGILVVLVTNQSGVGRGMFSETDVIKVHDHLQNLLAAYGAYLDAIYYCTNAPEDNAECRKPNPGMLIEAARKFQVDLKKTVIIGDKMADLEAGRRVGAITILVKTGYGAKLAESNPPEADWIVEDVVAGINLLI